MEFHMIYRHHHKSHWAFLFVEVLVTVAVAVTVTARKLVVMGNVVVVVARSLCGMDTRILEVTGEAAAAWFLGTAGGDLTIRS